MDQQAAVIRKLGKRGLADEIVGELRRTADFDSQAATNELMERGLKPLERPVRESRGVRHRNRSPCDRQLGKKACGVRAGPAQPQRQDLAETSSAAAGPRERLEPER